MGSHSVTCHPAEVKFPPLPQPIRASTRFSDPRWIQGWVDRVGLVTYQGGIYLPEDGHPSGSTLNNFVRTTNYATTALNRQRCVFPVQTDRQTDTLITILRIPTRLEGRRGWFMVRKLKLTSCTAVSWHFRPNVQRATCPARNPNPILERLSETSHRIGHRIASPRERTRRGTHEY